KSPSIDIKTNRKQSVYITCESSDSSLAGTLKRWGAIFLSWFHLHQKQYTLSFTEVSENVFNKQKTEKRGEKSHKLRKSTAIQYIILVEFITKAATVGFGVYLFNLTTGISKAMAIVLILALTGLPSCWGYFYRSSVVPANYYKSLRFRCVLYSVAIAIIAFNMNYTPLITGISILLESAYLFIFLKAKRFFTRAEV